jgi:hypothetical protein
MLPLPMSLELPELKDFIPENKKNKLITAQTFVRCF